MEVTCEGLGAEAEVGGGVMGALLGGDEELHAAALLAQRDPGQRPLQNEAPMKSDGVLWPHENNQSGRERSK